MARGHAPKREPRTPRKKKARNVEALSPPIVTLTEVEVIKKKRKPKGEEI